MSERVYTTVDKSEWGDGPWSDEPDKVQWKDEATGLPCLANRGPGGHWCGYVGVSPGHPAYEKDYNDIYDLFPDWSGDDERNGYLSVHGGLTYARHCAEGPEDTSICHIPDPGEPDHVWWLGFDCAHSGDLSPAYEARNRERYEQTGDPLWLQLGPSDRYWTLDYVRRETSNLARQLAAIA